MTPREDNYYEILYLFLSAYHGCCRNKFNSTGHADKWLKNENEVGYAYEGLEDVHYNPVEKLMLEIVSMILEAKRGPVQFIPYKKEVIGEIFKSHCLSELLSILPGNERLEFKADLWLCGFYKINNPHETEEILGLIRKPFLPFLQKKQNSLSFVIEEDLEERGKHGEIAMLLIEYYYYYCRLKLASGSPWFKDERELYYAYSQLRSIFISPLERLILEAALLILDAGRSPLAFQEKHRENVRRLLEQYDFMSIAIEKLPEIGALELASDLSSLGFWNYKEFSRKLENHN